MERNQENISSRRLIIISNRLPIVISKDEGNIKITPGSGGLVTALAPVLKNRGGLWIGWPGTFDVPQEEILKHIKQLNQNSGFSLHPVSLTKEEVELYYHGFSNEIIWPLFHDLITLSIFNPNFWRSYNEVNHKFAETVKGLVKKNDFIWVHDYQLLTLGQALKERGISSFISFFLHIPFPSLDIFLKLPWRFQILRALLEYDLIGFQTMRDKRNFIQCVKILLPEVRKTVSDQIQMLKVGSREVRIGAFPISIDYNEFAKQAEKEQVSERAWLFHEKQPDKKFIFSIDRLDYTKGIPLRLLAVKNLLKKYPELHQKITFIQVVIPSRTDIPQYQHLKSEIDALVSEINSEFTKDNWIPIHYIFRSLERDELLSLYRTSEIALITPIKDGMNLVAKEYIASNVEEKGILILSEFAGAAAELSNDAVIVNPFDIEGVSQAIYQSFLMPAEERKRRMKKLRRHLKRYDIFWWVKSFIKAAISQDLKDFPLIQEYVPPPPEEVLKE